MITICRIQNLVQDVPHLIYNKICVNLNVFDMKMVACAQMKFASEARLSQLFSLAIQS